MCSNLVRNDRDPWSVVCTVLPDVGNQLSQYLHSAGCFRFGDTDGADQVLDAPGTGLPACRSHSGCPGDVHQSQGHASQVCACVCVCVCVCVLTDVCLISDCN